jgi:hypothetical protein
MVINLVSILIIVLVVLLMFGIILNSVNNGKLQTYYNNPHMIPVQHNMQHDIQLQEYIKQYKEPEQRDHHAYKHSIPTLCEAPLNKTPEHVIVPSLHYNETPGFIDFPSSCQPYPKHNLQLATTRTGLGEPAYAHYAYKHSTPTLCEATLNKAPKHVVAPSLPYNENPGFIDFPSSCQPYPKPNPELATRGTGVGEPAYEDINEFPAPYTNDKKCCGRGDKHFFTVSPNDEYRETNVAIDYKINAPPINGLVCHRPSGIGEPAYEKENEFPAPYKELLDSYSSHGKCS